VERLEIIGLSAVAAQYGVQAFHFLLDRRHPRMVFLSGFMIPVYMRSGVRSLPEYLETTIRRARALIQIRASFWPWEQLFPIGLYAMAQVLHVVFRLVILQAAHFWQAGIVLIYVLLGGLRATIYNEVFQLLVIVLGLLRFFIPPQ